MDWIETRAVVNRSLVTALRLELDEGEAEAIAPAMEMPADLLLIDERLGRVAAASFGLRVIGLIGVMIEAKQRSMIQEVKPLLDTLIQQGFRISQELYHRVLQAADE